MDATSETITREIRRLFATPGSPARSVALDRLARQLERLQLLTDMASVPAKAL